MRFAHYDNKAVELRIADLKKMLRCPPLENTGLKFQKEVISDLKREKLRLSKEIWESIVLYMIDL